MLQDIFNGYGMSTDNLEQSEDTGLFYGWWIVLASMGAMVIASVFYWQGFSLFFPGLQGEFSTNRAALSGAISLSQLEGGMLGPVGGYLVERYGPRRMMTIGVVMMGIGYVLMSMVSSLVMFYIVFLAIISVGMSIGIRVPAMVAPANWFIKKRGRALGIAMTGSGLGGFFLPIIGWLIASYGWRPTMVIAGITIWVLGFPIARVMRRRPEEYGLLPDGEKPVPKLQIVEDAPVETTGLATPSIPEAPSTVDGEADFSLRDALKLPVFWFLAIAFGLRQFAVGAISLHQVPYLVDTGRSLETTSIILAAVTLTSIIGRLGFGTLADHFPPRYIMAFSMMMVGLGAFILSHVTEGMGMLVLYIAVYAIGWGGGATTMNATRGAYFGRRAFGTISGSMDFVQMFGLVLGPVFAGFVFDRTGSYTIAFNSFAISAVAAGVLMFFLRPPKQD
jgi:sugar phosphate permease